MLIKFQKHITNQFSELQKQPFLLACSGGLDSVVLTHLCYLSKLDFTLAHCNFNLRGAESDSDETFVKELAYEVGAKIFITHFNTKRYVDENKISIEMAARELRYAWFADLMKKYGFSMVLTAHHADDNMETFIINLSRGTGIDGLTGMDGKSSGVFRPLLPFSRNEIVNFAEAHNLKWREDSSNIDTVHLRNKIRHEVVPVLKELHPTFLDNFKMTQTYLSDAAKMLSDYVDLLQQNLFEYESNFIKIPIHKIETLQPQKSYLFYLFKDYGFKAWNDILHLMPGLSGKEVRSATHRLVKDRDYLLLEELKTESDSQFFIQKDVTEIKEPLDIIISEVTEIDIIDKNILYVDKSSLNFPLVVRKWKKGDYFYPLGMSGKKKLSKYFKDEKIDVISKGKQWLLCSENKIVWVIGKRADNRFKVTKNTKKILKFKRVE